VYKLFDDVEIMRKPEAAPSIDDVIVAIWREKTLFMPFFPYFCTLQYLAAM
jgi:hypothetical protein